MSGTPTEWTVVVPEGKEGAGKNVTVRLGADEIVVRWVCGAMRHFTPEALTNALADFDAVSRYAEVWIDNRDSKGSRYAARLSNGDFRADEEVAGRTMYEVPWDEFRAALDASLAAAAAKAARPKRGTRTPKAKP